MFEHVDDMAHGSSVEALRERFRSLWVRCLAPAVESRDGSVFVELARRYSEPRRRYHGWNHLLHCLKQFDLAAALMNEPDAVEMALWFHDAVYDFGAPDNEQKSAELFTQLAERQFSSAFVDKVDALILLTRHQQAPTDWDQRFMVDIDLSSLALDWDTFTRDSENIRQENEHLEDDVFYPKQAGFLESLLARRSIYYSDFFSKLYERAARDNIARFIGRLGSRGPSS
jgi:predicted metal-dependent HD superfamily phosphohydrolase